MKKITSIFIVLLSFSACSLSHEYLKQGNYQAAIEVGASKMLRNPKKADKTILAIERAFKIEKSRILDNVGQLKIEGNPENWLSIYDLYKQLDQYQKLLKPVLPMFIRKEFRNADIQLVNIDQELSETKRKAAEYLYVSAQQLLTQNNKQTARQAFVRFSEVKTLINNFKDVDAKLQEAYIKGQNHIIIHHTNNSNLIIPQEFMTNLSRFNPEELNTQWTKFYLNSQKTTEFDYAIEVRIQSIEIGPEQVKQNQYQDIKKIQDGFQYVLDGKGNVAKDSLGNDITEPKYIDAVALITQTEQTKVGTLVGVVEFKNTNKQSFKSFPFREDLVFQNYFGIMQGDQRALSDQTKKLLGGRALQFPTDLQMVLDASQLIKTNTFNIIKSNTQLVN